MASTLNLWSGVSKCIALNRKTRNKYMQEPTSSIKSIRYQYFAGRQQSCRMVMFSIVSVCPRGPHVIIAFDHTVQDSLGLSPGPGLVRPPWDLIGQTSPASDI